MTDNEGTRPEEDEEEDWMKMLLHLQQMKKTPKWGTLRLMTNLTRTWRKYHAHHRLQATSTWYA
jgi:hypothetical protein